MYMFSSERFAVVSFLFLLTILTRVTQYAAQRAPITQTRKCETLFMCPPFCMKMKDGCYVCDCGTLSTYMDDMSKEVQKIATNGISQTGTEVQTMSLQGGEKKPNTQGYRANVFPEHTEQEEQGLGRYLTGSGNGQFQTEWNGMGQNNYFTNLQQGPFMPDFSAYNMHPKDGLLGMNCPSLSYDCPAECWRTDIITGCLDCFCAGMGMTNFKKTTEKSTVEIKSTPIEGSTTEPKTEATSTLVSHKTTPASTASTTSKGLTTTSNTEPTSNEVRTLTTTSIITTEIDTSTSAKSTGTTTAKTNGTTISLTTSSTPPNETPTKMELNETTTKLPTTTLVPVLSTPLTRHAGMINFLFSKADNNLTSYKSKQETENSTEIDHLGSLTGMNTNIKAQTLTTFENGTLLSINVTVPTSPALIPSTSGPCPPFHCNLTCGNRPYLKDDQGCFKCVCKLT